MYTVLLKILDTKDSGGSVQEALGCHATGKSGLLHDDDNDDASDTVDKDDDVIKEGERVEELLNQTQVHNVFILLSVIMAVWCSPYKKLG